MRLCVKCDSNEIEDELHFLLLCSSHQEQRVQLVSKACKVIPNFNNMNDKDKFKSILSSSDSELINEIGIFLNKTLQCIQELV